MEINGERVTKEIVARKAKALQTAKGKNAKLQNCYNEVARGYGFKDWAHLKAAIKGRCHSEPAGEEKQIDA